jgi:hypothetical protein
LVRILLWNLAARKFFMLKLLTKKGFLPMTRTFNFRSVLAALLLTCCFQSAFAQTFWTETFSDQASSTTNWVHGGTNAGALTWSWTNILNAGNWTPGNFGSPTGSTGYMWFDSDANAEFDHDVTLTNVNIPVDCSDKSNVHLKFFTYYRTFTGGDVARIGVSTDGTNFTYFNVPQFDNLVAESTGNPQVYQGYIDIPLPQADNQAQVWIQFRWQGNYEYYWKVDDIELYEEEAAVPCDQNPMSIICDNLDSYTTGALGPQAAHWTTWSGTEGGTEDGIVSTEQASSAPNSLKVISTTAGLGPQDVVLDLGNRTTGRYELKFKMYIPTGQWGYYNMQNNVPIGTTPVWNFNVHFEANGAGRFTDTGDALLANFTYPYDQWFDCVHVIDLDNNLQTFSVNGNFVKKTGYTGNLGGIDFFGTNATSTFYVDDVEYVELDPIVFDEDLCGGAVDLSLYFGQAPTVPQTTGLYDNTNATVDAGDPAAPSCWADGVTQTLPAVPKIDGSMWYTFTGDGNTYHIETVPCSSTNYIDGGDTQMAIYTGECGSLSQVLCNEDLTGAADFRAGLDIETENGTNYYMLIDGWSDDAGVVSLGEFCIQITQLPAIDCGDGEVGTYTVGNGGFICDGATTGPSFTINNASFVIPNIGPVYGMAWAITTEEVPAGTWPPTLDSYWGSFGVNANIYAPNLTNNGNPLTQNAIWYFTPIVVAGAVDTVPSTAGRFLHELDLTDACFFVGESTPLILLDELAPLDAVPDVTPATGGQNNGAIDLTVTGGIFDIIQDPASSYTVEWTGPNGFISNDEDISGLEPGDYTVVVTDITGCADPYELTVSVTSSVKDPASVKSLTLTPNPTADATLLNLSLANAAEVRLEVVNTLGQTLRTLNAGKVNVLSQRVELSDLATGTYFLRVVIDGETAVRRVVVQR